MGAWPHRLGDPRREEFKRGVLRLTNGHQGAVLVIDVDADCRAASTAALERAGYAARELESGSEALAAAREERPILVAIEVWLPDITGYEVCRELKEELGDDLPVFLMSGERTESIDRLVGLLLGADDFILKPFKPGELVARVRRFVTRASSSPADPSQPVNGNRGRDFHITAREHEILRLLAAGQSQKQIAESLSISSKTVATHIQRLLTKLDAHSRAQLVSLAYLAELV
jgi:DNA-binding NarL/FixJ family response regulator